jgi:hypothetical protein
MQLSRNAPPREEPRDRPHFRARARTEDVRFDVLGMQPAEENR